MVQATAMLGQKEANIAPLTPTNRKALIEVVEHHIDVICVEMTAPLGLQHHETLAAAYQRERLPIGIRQLLEALLE